MQTAADSTALFLRFAQHRDPAALAEVFDRTAPVLLRVARRLAGNLPDAEDLVQETFVAALQSARRFRGGNLEAWLTAILERRARRLHRRRRRGHTIDDPAAADPGPGPEESVASRDACAHVAGAIDRLGEPYRSVLRLRMRHGFTAAQIGVALDRSAETVQSQLRRGLETLRERVGAGAMALAAVDPSTPHPGELKRTVLAYARRSATATPVVTTVGATAAAALLAVTLGATWWMSATRDPATPTRIASESAPGPSRAAAEPIEDRRSVVVDDPAPEAVEPPRDDPFEIVALTVRDGTTGEPVVGAEVLYRDTSQPDLRNQYAGYAAYQRVYRLLDSTPEPIYRDHGQMAVSDGRGQVALPRSAKWSPILARDGDHYGARWEFEEGREVLLFPSQDLEVHVRDTDGEPVAGVAVHLGDVRANPQDLRGVVRRAVTDDLGVARLNEIQDLLRVLRFRGRASIRVGVGLLLPAHRMPPELRVDHWPAGPLEIVVPRTAALRVRKVATDGGPLPTDGYAKLDVAGCEGSEWFSFEAGEAVLQHVPVGRALRLSNRAGDTLDLAPLTIGEARDVDFVVGRTRFVCFGRAFRADGSLAAHDRIEVISSGYHSTVDCDDEGYFEIESYGVGDGTEITLWRRDTLRYRCGIHDEDRPSGESARVGIDSSSPGTVARLGDVRFEAVSPRWTGTVRLATGADLGRLPWDDFLVLQSWQKPFVRDDWKFERCRGAAVRLDADGSLTITVPDDARGPFRLEVQSGLFDREPELTLTLPQDPLPLPEAGGTIDLTLDVAGRLTWVCEDPDITQAALEFEPIAPLRPGDPLSQRVVFDWAEVTDWQEALRPHRLFHVGWSRHLLTPGRYQVTVRRRADEGGEVLARYPDVRIEPAATTRLIQAGGA